MDSVSALDVILIRTIRTAMSELEGILCPGSAYVLEKVGVTGAVTEKVIISVHPDRFEGCWLVMAPGQSR